VVGAGPAGAALALAIARQGIPVTVVEASPHPAHRFRGEALMPSGLEALAALGLQPLPQQVRRRALRGWSFFLEGRPLFEVEEPLDGDQPCTLIDQPELLAALLAEAGRCDHVRLITGTAVGDLRRDGERVTGVRLSDGRCLQADLVVACDGRSSPLRRQAGLPLVEQAAPIDVLWFEMRREGPPGVAELAEWIAGRFVTVVGGTGTFALFETVRGTVQLGWLLDAGATVPIPPRGWPVLWAENAPAELAARLIDLPPTALAPPQRLSVRVGHAPCWHRPGLLLLGDAAHPMSPVRAQGINMALRDAVRAANLLGPCLKGCPEPPLTAVLERLQERRLAEILPIQRLQERETGRGLLLRRNGWLRRTLAATAPWSGPLLARRWVGEQHLLRHGRGPAGSA
jgi:2-polyprenyl-6-methoxyphenol hydroxylase-like FAD-dependent oxidoreductase